MTAEIQREILKMQQSFLIQKDIAIRCNKVFELYSKQAIPECWKQWFIQNNINFFEGI